MLRFRQYASNEQPKKEIPVYMTHCSEQILTLASQHFPLYHSFRSAESYIILQSSQYRQKKLDKLLRLLVSLQIAPVNLLSISLKHRRKEFFSQALEQASPTGRNAELRKDLDSVSSFTSLKQA